MRGSMSVEMEVSVPAMEAWKLYSSVMLTKMIQEKHKLAERIEIQGHGEVGTLVKFILTPGDSSGFDSVTEKVTKVDHEKRLKEAEIVGGCQLEIGFNMYRLRYEIIEKEGASSPTCITRSTTEFEIKDEFAANASFVNIQTQVKVMQVAKDYLIAKTNE